jgi:hypothetical protein
MNTTVSMVCIIAMNTFGTYTYHWRSTLLHSCTMSASTLSAIHSIHKPLDTLLSWETARSQSFTSSTVYIHVPNIATDPPVRVIIRVADSAASDTDVATECPVHYCRCEYYTDRSSLTEIDYIWCKGSFGWIYYLKSVSILTVNLKLEWKQLRFTFDIRKWPATEGTWRNPFCHKFIKYITPTSVIIFNYFLYLLLNTDLHSWLIFLLIRLSYC